MVDTKNNSEPNDESLIWRAFRYVSNELTDQEVSDFETRLDGDSDTFDVAACEAVAQAVQLSDAVTQVFETKPKTTTPETPQLAVVDVRSASRTTRHVTIGRRLSVLASSVAVLAVAWMFNNSGIDSDVVVVEPETDSAVASEIVRSWADSASEVDVIADDQQLMAVVDIPDSMSVDVPDWLLIAVRSQQDFPDAFSEPEVMEN